MRTLLRAVVSLAILASGTACWAATEWDMPTAYADSEFQTENIHLFAKDVEKATNGQLKITVHSGASLYKMPEITPAVQSGQVPIGEIVLSFLANQSPLFATDWIPFLAPTYKDAMRLWEAYRPAVDDYFAKQGIRVLYVVPWPAQELFSKRPIRSISDLQGTKMRAYNRPTAEIAKLAGATPVQVEAAEMSQAFATGVVESVITSASSFYNNQLYEYLKYGYDVRASLPKDIVFVNAKALGSLEPKLQQALLDAASKAQTRGWEMSEKAGSEYVTKLREKGVNFQEPTPELKAGLTKIGQQLATEWKKEAGPVGEQILRKYEGQ